MPEQISKRPPPQMGSTISQRHMVCCTVCLTYQFIAANDVAFQTSTGQIQLPWTEFQAVREPGLDFKTVLRAPPGHLIFVSDSYIRVCKLLTQRCCSGIELAWFPQGSWKQTVKKKCQFYDRPLRQSFRTGQMIIRFWEGHAFNLYTGEYELKSLSSVCRRICYNDYIY